jgi:hypothetical protein
VDGLVVVRACDGRIGDDLDEDEDDDTNNLVQQ